MECSDDDNVKPLDKLLDDKAREFESGEDRICDKELDTLIWELGDYETGEAPQEAGEYEEAKPIEEELVEKSITVGRSGRTSFKEKRIEADFAEEGIAAASSLGSEKERKETKILHRVHVPDNRMLETNKKIVRAFYEIVFNQHQPAEAAKKYIGDKYIQHNPYVADGTEAFSEYFKGYFDEHPKSRVEVKRVIAEGDLVVLHLNSRTDDEDRGSAIVDIFRVENGKIVEHWDVVQAVPPRAANSNTMF